MANLAHTIPFRRDIQGLRAVAIALVVLAHAHVPGFAGGFVGVDVFFVLSGYLITGLLVRERLSTGGIRYSQFLSRRLRRLLPAMLAMLAVVLVLATLLLSAYETRMQTGSFTKSCFTIFLGDQGYRRTPWARTRPNNTQLKHLINFFLNDCSLSQWDSVCPLLYWFALSFDFNRI